MAIDYNRFTKVQAGMYVTNEDKALDGRIVVEEESQIDHIVYPYLGMIVYAKKEDKYFKINTLKGGYSLIDQDTFERVGNLYPILDELAAANGMDISLMEEWVNYEPVDKCFVDEYEELPFDKIGDCNYIIVADEATRDTFTNTRKECFVM